MPIIKDDELWEQLRKKYNVNSNLEAIMEVEKESPG